MLFKKSKKALIIGCGRFGASLAGVLSDKGYHITMVDNDSTAFRKLPDNFSGYEVTGDGTNTDLLVNIGIEDTDMVIAVTADDNTNSLVAQIASRIYFVPKVYMRISDTDKEKLIDGFNIEVICPYKLCMNEFEHLSHISLEEVDK